VEPTPLAAASDADQSSAHVEEHETSEDTPSEERQTDDEWPMHRRLIRAQLPRVEGQTPERKEPDFTVRRPTGRGPDANRGGGQRQRNNHRPMRHTQGDGQSNGQPSRFGGPRHGDHRQRQGSGQGGQQQGNRPGRPGGQGRGGQQPGGQGRKRGR